MRRWASLGLVAQAVSSRASDTDAKQDLIAAQLLIEAGADLAEVERWIHERVKRAEPKIMRPYGWQA